ncbi:MAG: 50S ribosomal protein L11 methyltransferase [Paramuribaculum sp.]|nr:50S ribosomal protein L11 methyltransferase [Paramuribaculum sp.]
MNDYVEVRFDLTPCNETYTDVIASILAERGFESFVPDETGLTAYIKKEDFTPDCTDILSLLPFECDINVSIDVIEGQDWNAEWEKNYFKPIVIGNQCVIHSSFHKDVPKCRLDIVIDPKMAFGTGHHATTSQMAERIMNSDVRGKKVIDMGTGTGILAIIAAMEGANEVIGVEIDPAAHANAQENIALNSHPEIDIRLGDVKCVENVSEADLLLANINRNIIIADIAAYARALRAGGTMFLSGFYAEDIPLITAEAKKYGLTLTESTEQNKWACITLTKIPE